MDFKLYFKISILIFLFLSCQKDKLSTRCPSAIASGLIIGTNDWIVFNQTGDYPQNSNEQTVAHIKIPVMMASCTGFLINEDTIMTNNHCISSASRAVNVTALFRNEDESRTTFVCDQFITTNLQYDFTLIKCKNAPGAKFGWVGLSKEKPEQYSQLYLVQENCDYISDPHCIVDKFVAFGEVLESQATRIYHNADTLGGSSGSPIFSEDTHQVIAIHNAASYASATSTEKNAGVPMYQIRNIIETTTDVVIHEFGSAGVYPTVPDPEPTPTIEPTPNQGSGSLTVNGEENCKA